MDPTATLPQNNASAPPRPQLDTNIINLAKAIRDNESGGNYQAVGGSGEYGAYQITPGLWNGTAPKYGITSQLNAATPEEQNKFVYQRLAELQAQGLNPGQIASQWNSGSPDPTGKVGVNSSGVAYNTPQYVDNVYNSYMGYKNAAQQQAPAQGNGLPQYGAAFPYQQGDNPLVAGAKAVGNLPTSVYGFGKGIADMVFHPIQTIQNIGGVAIGGIEEATHSPQSDQTQMFDGLVKALKDRYGGLDQLTNTAVNDPFGLGADIAGLLAGGAGIAGKGAELADLTGAVGRTVTKPLEGAVGRLASPFGSAVDEGVEEAAGRLGLQSSELPASARSTSPVVSSLEGMAGNVIGGEGVVARATSAADRLSAIADDIVTRAGGAQDLASAGEEIGNGLKKFINEYKTATSDVYNAAEATLGQKLARTNNAVDTLTNILARKAEIGDTADANFFQAKLDALENAKNPPTFGTLKRMRTDIMSRAEGSFGDPFAKANKVQLKTFSHALTTDMEETMLAAAKRSKKMANIVSDYQAANKVYATGRQLAGTTLVKSVINFSRNQQWDRIIPALLKPSVSVTDIKNIMAMTGEAGSAQIRTSVLRDLFDKAINADGHFMPSTLGKYLEKTQNADKLRAILTPEQFQGLQDVATIAKSFGRLSKKLQGSQTAFLLEKLGAGSVLAWGAVDLLTGNLLGAAQKIGGVLGTYGASRFISSDLGQRLLTEGLSTPSLGKDLLRQANEQGLTPPSASNTLPANEDSALGIGSPRVGNDINTPPKSTAGEVAAAQRVPGEGTPLKSEFKAATTAGRMKDAVQNYLENVRMGLSTKDVTEGGQKINIGLTSVKGAQATPADDLVAEGDALYKEGNYAEAQKKYNQALEGGINTLSNAFDGTGIKVKPRGVSFGMYGSLEPNYDAVAIVPKGKEDLFHYILSDVADKQFHQYSMLTYKQVAPETAFGVTDEARGISVEPQLRFNLEKPLTAEDAAKVQELATKNDLPGFSVREGGKAIDIINLSAYNKDYEKFSSSLQSFAADLKQQGISGTPELWTSEARFIGSDPGEGHGLASYQSVRDKFRSENPGYFNTDSGVTSRVLERLKNKQAVSPQELEQITKQQDITPLERSAVLDAVANEPAAKKIPTSDLAVRIEGKSLPVTITETDRYADYGLDNVGLDRSHAPSEFDGVGARTLVFETPVEHGDQGHFANPNHFGHTRIYIENGDLKPGGAEALRAFDAQAEADDRAGKLVHGYRADRQKLVDKWSEKVGYITEMQSDVAQHTDIAEKLASKDIATIRDRRLAEAGKDESYNALRTAYQKAEDEVTKANDERRFGDNVSDARKNELLNLVGEKKREMDDLQAKLDAYRAQKNTEFEAEVAQAKQNINPQQKQLVAMLKDRSKYQDVMLRGTLQYFKDKGVQEVRVATPSTAAKIEGFVNDEGNAPYDHVGGDFVRPDDADFAPGDQLDYLGEKHTVVESTGDNITVAPSDKVRSFRLSEFLDDEAQNTWDEMAKGDFEPLATKGGDVTPEAAQKALDSLARTEKGSAGKDDIAYFEYWGTKSILEDIANSDKRWGMSDIEEAVKDRYHESNDGISYLQDVYGKDSVFWDGMGNGRSDPEVYIVKDGANTENLGQPSTYGNSMRSEDLHTIDKNPREIEKNFDKSQASVLMNYVDLYEKPLKKLAKENNIKISYHNEDNADYEPTWWSFPLPKVKKYLFGA